MRFQYTGPGPIEILSGGDLIRPGDVREFDAEPDYGPWERLDPEPETPAPVQAFPVRPLPLPSTNEGPAIPLNTPGGM